MALKKFAPKLPLESNGKDNFVLIDNSLTNAKQLLRMLIFTNPGEKLMDPEFGIGIKKYLFEQTSGMLVQDELGFRIEDIQQDIAQKLVDQTIKYAPDIYIKSVGVFIEENIMNLSINYSYKGYPQDLVSYKVTI